jgi:hypothetical protein
MSIGYLKYEDKQEEVCHLLSLQMITNDLATGVEQTSTETKCKCHFLLKLLFRLGIALPL